ncbi:MAG: hypothetical protein ACKVP5_23775, partial [Aestuariivirga sp.]
RHQWFKLRPFLVGKIESHGSPPPTVNQLLCCKSTAYVSTDPNLVLSICIGSSRQRLAARFTFLGNKLIKYE